MSPIRKVAAITVYKKKLVKLHLHLKQERYQATVNPIRVLEIWRTRQIYDNYLPQDFEYKTMAERLDQDLDTSSSKEMKSKNVQELQNHYRSQSPKQSNAKDTFEQNQEVRIRSFQRTGWFSTKKK